MSVSARRWIVYQFERTQCRARRHHVICPKKGGDLQLFPVDAPLVIHSGGQTGVDRAALDVALELGLPCGGWCPKGRRAEDGPIPARYPLIETSSPFYPQRTKRNVLDSDGTLILTFGCPTGGTALTIRTAAAT